MPTRRRFLATTLGGAAALYLPAGAHAEGAWPERPVRLVVPFPPGSGPDLTSRLLAPRLSEVWKQPVIVDNKPGASSIIGTSEVVRAKPDGHTVLVALSLLVQNPSLRNDLPYDTFKDLAPVVPLTYDPLFLVAAKSLEAQNLEALLQAARARPGTLAFGSWGNGSTAHLLLIGLQQAAGVDIIHVPYTGTAAVAQAMMSGEIQMGLLPYATARSLVEGGAGVAVGVTGAQRSPSLPAVPTLQEQGLQGFNRMGWVGLFVPTGTPAAVVDKINRDVNEALRMPGLEPRLRDTGTIPAGGTTPAFADLVRTDYDYWHGLIRAGKVTLQ